MYIACEIESRFASICNSWNKGNKGFAHGKAVAPGGRRGKHG